MIGTLAQVALGGAIGASARYLTNVAVLRGIGPGFPWATVVVNVAGSFLMGVLVVWLAEKGAMRLAPLLMTGILGGFTTFSAFSLDTVALWERGEPMLAAAYVGGSVVLSVAALLAGMALTRGVFT
jgi:fluoride exporter